MSAPPSSPRSLLATALLLSLLAPAASQASETAHPSGPPFGIPEGRELETRLNAWETRTHTVETFLKRKLCPALKEHGNLAGKLFEESATVVLPGATEVPLKVELLGLTGTSLSPGEAQTLDRDALGAALETWLAPHATRSRCSMGFHTSVIFKGEPFLAQGRFHLIFGSRDARGGPIMDTLEGSFELRGHGKGKRRTLELSRLDLGPVTRLRATASRFVDVTGAAGLPSVFKEYSSDLTLDGPDRGSLSVFDVNGDGWLDIHVGRAGENYLFVSQGDGTFQDRAKAYGLDDAGSARAVQFLDLDGDGDEDAVVTNAVQIKRPGGIVIYERDGDRFKKAFTLSRGKENAYRSMSAGDVDRDGDLDLFICNYGRPDLKVRGDPSLLDDPSGAPDLLLINESKDGKLHFVDRAKEWGLADTGWTYASALADLDGDGWLDLAVADDFGAKRLYRNTGEGSFEDLSEKAGVGRERAAGMAVDVADLDGDGNLDLYFSNMHSNAGTRLANFLPETEAVAGRIGRAAAGNTLWLGRGDLNFQEVGVPMGVADGGWAWGSRFLDLDQKGGTELASPCGFITGPELEDG